jgi:Dolichyl-phosphate-mannose-protein mannosyltransferase
VLTLSKVANLAPNRRGFGELSGASSSSWSGKMTTTFMSKLKNKFVCQGEITRNDLIFVFILAIFARCIFVAWSGLGPALTGDYSRYDDQSNRILLGDFNLVSVNFITAPLFPYVLAGMKYVFGIHYTAALQTLQICLSGVSALFLLETAQLIFSDYRTSILTGIAFAIYPITLYYVHGVGQESIFQSLFIISVYYFVEYLHSRSRRTLIYFAFLFSLAMLTKSHIILVAPFLLLSIAITYGLHKDTILDLCSVIGVIFVVTLPYGIYNKMVNGAYIVSSSGQGNSFLFGHNDDTYRFVVNPPPQDSPEFKRILNGQQEFYERLAPQLRNLNDQGRQNVYLKDGIEWCINNPTKLVRLTWEYFYLFLMPGASFHHHPLNAWLAMFVASAPIFALAYFEIIRRIVEDYKKHLAVISIFLGMLVFSLVFFPQARFRVVTIEQFYLMYAASGLVFILDYFKNNLDRMQSTS